MKSNIGLAAALLMLAAPLSARADAVKADAVKADSSSRECGGKAASRMSHPMTIRIRQGLRG